MGGGGLVQSAPVAIDNLQDLHVNQACGPRAGGKPWSLLKSATVATTGDRSVSFTVNCRCEHQRNDPGTHRRPDPDRASGGPRPADRAGATGGAQRAGRPDAL